MAIPIEKSETEDFVPPSLECMGDDAPVFRLKSPSERCRRRFRQLCGDDGLTMYDADDFNTEKLKAIDLYWEADVAQSYRMKFTEIAEKAKQGIDLTPEELAWVDDLEEQLFDAHKPLRVMRRKTGEFNEYAPRHALSVYVAGWKGLDVAFKLDGGVIASDSIDALGKALTKLGEEHVRDAPSTPFIELYVAATKRLSLDPEETKNSPSPSQPTASQDASTEAGDSAKKSKPSSAATAAASPDTSNSPEASPPSG